MKTREKNEDIIMAYNFATLAPSAAAKKNPKLAENNESVFQAGGVYGVEVTDKALASRCIFNLDPQHDGSGSNLAAIEVALNVELPQDGCTLATIRADLDSFGSMAVFQLRAENHEFSREEIERISIIAIADKARSDVWEPQDLSIEGVKAACKSAPLAGIAAAVADFKVEVSNRVNFVKEFILNGTEPEGYRQKYEDAQLANARALESGEIEIKVRENVALVQSSHRAATSIGYAQAPVVIALNPSFKGNDGSLEPHAKFTVCQFSSGYCDIVAVGKELAEREAGWGGSTVLVGSPQGIASCLSLEEVYEVVKKHLK
jgi:hypothetical protein